MAGPVAGSPPRISPVRGASPAPLPPRLAIPTPQARVPPPPARLPIPPLQPAGPPVQRKAILPVPLPARPAAAPRRPAPPPTPPRGVAQPAFPSTADAEEIGEAIGTALRPIVRPLFGIEDDPTNPLEDLSAGLPWWRRWSLGTRGLVDELFRRFGSYGYQYHVGMGISDVLLGTFHGYRRTDLADGLLQGNCIAYAHAFARLLQHFGIRAEMRQVRRESQGPFVTRVVNNFIDPQVTGNIRYKNGGIIPGRYLFTNHAATYVPDLGVYYDPMIRRSYADFATFIDPAWGLRPMDGSGDRYWLANPQYGGNAVVRSERSAPGFPGTWQLVKRKGRFKG